MFLEVCLPVIALGLSKDIAMVYKLCLANVLRSCWLQHCHLLHPCRPASAVSVGFGNKASWTYASLGNLILEGLARMI